MKTKWKKRIFYLIIHNYRIAWWWYWVSGKCNPGSVCLYLLEIVFFFFIAKPIDIFLFFWSERWTKGTKNHDNNNNKVRVNCFSHSLCNSEVPFEWNYFKSFSHFVRWTRYKRQQQSDSKKCCFILNKYIFMYIVISFSLVLKKCK